MTVNLARLLLDLVGALWSECHGLFCEKAVLMQCDVIEIKIFNWCLETR